MKTPVTVLRQDWFGVRHPAVPTFSLRLESGAIVLRAWATKPALMVADDKRGYTAGLWEGDCAELFLLNPATGYYLEFNLSPKGGWWSCAFTAPRVRVPEGPVAVAGVSATGAVAPGSWRSELRIPVASLPPELAFDPATTRGNVTFCLGNDPQRYLTAADLGGGTPDFHRPAKWVRLF